MAQEVHVHHWRTCYVYVDLAEAWLDGVIRPVRERLHYKVCDVCRKVLL